MVDTNFHFHPNREHFSSLSARQDPDPGYPCCHFHTEACFVLSVAVSDEIEQQLSALHTKICLSKKVMGMLNNFECINNLTYFYLSKQTGQRESSEKVDQEPSPVSLDVSPPL